MRSREVWLYVALSCAMSWAWWLPMALTGQVSRAGQGWPTHLPGLLGPAVAALVTAALIEGRPGVRRLLRGCVRVPGGARWLLTVAAVPALAGLVIAGRRLAGEPWPSTTDLTTYSGAAVLPLFVLVPVVVLVNGLGEELGWRGYLADHLLRERSLPVTALVVALVWGLWHLPLFWVVADFRSLGWMFPGWALGLLAGSVVLTWLYRGSGGSVLLVALWHSAFNLVTATPATSSTVAPVVSTAVMLLAVALVVRERRQRMGPLVHSAPSA